MDRPPDGHTLPMYFDHRPCETCGSEVEIRPHAELSSEGDPDGSVDERVCTNPECPTNTADA
jgi:hypothetical protein